MIEYPAEALLFDNYSSRTFGGTGKAFDWNLLKTFTNLPEFFLSGGISIDNVERAFREIHPSGVDVSSSLELKPGFKDPKKMETFFYKVNHLRYA